MSRSRYETLILRAEVGTYPIEQWMIDEKKKPKLRILI